MFTKKCIQLHVDILYKISYCLNSVAVLLGVIIIFFEFLTLVKRDFSGKMGFNEFKELWGALNQWKVSQ